MHEDFSRALEAGAMAITAGRRLARVLTSQFHKSQQAQGNAVWNTPDILPLEAFLRRTWTDSLLRGGATQPNRATLLDAFQEQMVWEQVIRESPEGDSLLRIPETARQAMEAWRLVQAYRLPVDARFEASEDWAAFAGWSRAFRMRLDVNGWLEEARLPDMIAGLVRNGEVAKPKKVFVAGFEEMTPQQSDLFAALGDCTAVESSQENAWLEYWKFRDGRAEIQAAAAWARRLVERNPTAQIGVVVPALTSVRLKVERIFREILDPAAGLDDRDAAFHVSLGPALSEYPVINAALLMLEFTAGPLPLPEVGRLLRSPFLAGSSAEWTKRAQIDAKLRRDGVWSLNAEFLRDRTANSRLQELLSRFQDKVRQLAAKQSASDWSRDFSRLLEALGWPGDRTLDSREHQVIAKWHDLLSNLAALDFALPPLSFSEALARLREVASASPFQIENQGAPVQIMGLLEATGLRFDHLWVMGLTDEALPASANPNPFLPISLQREHRLPHASAEAELEFSRKIIDGLCASAPRVVLSYPAAEGDRVLNPSPIVAGGDWLTAAESEQPAEWVQRIRASVRMDELADESAPPVVAESMQRGGASLFKDMAACPFRAFAKHRLGARELEEVDLGVNARDQGNAVHKALAAIWSELQSHARLRELSPEGLNGLISRAAEMAIQQLGGGIGHNLEKLRLERLLAVWLDIEKSRETFVVSATEQQNEVSIGGLQVRTRADRVDRLPDGREIILDYKTGQPGSNPWEGERPDDPQIPLYCATSAEQIGGAVFALIRIGELGFKGITDRDVSLPELDRMKTNLSAGIGEQIGEWRTVLERLAKKFCAGDARVDPKPDACDFCRLQALCRIREYGNDRG